MIFTGIDYSTDGSCTVTGAYVNGIYYILDVKYEKENDMKQHKHAAVLQAIAEGEKIQCKVYLTETEWEDMSDCGLQTQNPLNRSDWMWRVKPKDIVRKARVVLPGIGEILLDESGWGENNVAFTFDDENGKLKGVELL